MGKYSKNITRKSKRKTRKTRKNYKKISQKGGFISPFQGTAYSQDNLPGMSINSSGIPNSTFYPLNNYKETPMQYMKGGKKSKSRRSRVRRSKAKKTRVKRSNGRKSRVKRSQKGGFYSDAVNLGRYAKFESGSTWNALNGYDKPVNPLPWEDQYQTKTYNNYSTI